MTDTGRTVTANAAIALGIVGAVQMLFVSPARQQADATRHEVAALSAQASAVRDPTTAGQGLDARERRANARLREIRGYNAYADPARLIGDVQAMGDAAGVTINRIDPETIDPRAGFQSSDARVQARPTTEVRLSIEARGGYADVTRFVAALEARPGFVRTTEVSLRPSMAPGEDSVGVTIRTAQLAFNPDVFMPKAPDAINTAAHTVGGGS